MPGFKIADREIGEGHRVFVIAEAGVNHNGDPDRAKNMIDASVEAGADAIKFQTYNTPDLVLREVGKAPYQKQTTSRDETQFEMLESFQIDRDFHFRMDEYCKQRSILFLSTPYDDRSLNLLVELQVPAIKVASTDTANVLFLEKVAAAHKPVIFSTGMSNIFEVDLAYWTLKKNGCNELAILKCTSSYPTERSEVHLNAMISLARMFPDAIIGFSDHTEGVGASPYAVAMGARIVEKHFTLDKTLPGPDHRASLGPMELRAWVQEIRRAEEMLGEYILRATQSEQESKRALQKCLVAKQEIGVGEKLSRQNITAKRTGGVGIPASMAFEALGKTAGRKIEANTVVHWRLLED